DATAEVERAIEDDVGDGEAVAGDPRLPREQAVEPDEIVAHGCLEAVGSFRQHAEARAEELDSLGEAEAVVEVLGDAQLATSLPAARLRPVLRRRTHQRRRRMAFLQVLEDGDRLADHASGAPLER